MKAKCYYRIFLQRVHDKTLDKDVNIGKKNCCWNTNFKNNSRKNERRTFIGVVMGNGHSGKRYSIENYSVSGKTGTAEVVDPKTGTYYKSPYKVLHSFIGYAPSENPEVILYVGMKLPNKKLAESSANGASEIFKPIMQNILNYLNVKKTSSDENLQKLYDG